MKILYIFLSLLLVIILVIIFRKNGTHSLSETCTEDNDCGVGFSCQSDPENGGVKKCFPSKMIFCPISPTTSLIECTPDSDYCENLCLNSPKFTCVQVSSDKPYIWKKDGENINIPNSPKDKGWCLPNIENKNLTCNPFTSDYVLSETSPGSGKYSWSCLCKYPGLFDHSSGAGSDCTLVRACGEEVPGKPLGTLLVPTEKLCKSDSECEHGEKCMNPLSPTPCGDGSTGVDCETGKCVCHKRWEGETVNNINPLSGRCVCNSEYDFQCLNVQGDYQFNCVKGYCRTPNGASEDTKNCDPDKCRKIDGNCVCCSCPKGWLRCPDDVSENNPNLLELCRNIGPMCIRDPCQTSDVPDGYYDKETGFCICPSEDGTAISYNDTSSPVGVICKDLCRGDNNPCGNRGKCYVPDGSSQALCCDCVAPWTNKGDINCSCSVASGKTPNGMPCCFNTDCASGNCNGSSGDGTACYETTCGGDACDTRPLNSPCNPNDPDCDVGTCSGPLPIDPDSVCGTPCIPQGVPVVCPDGTSTCPYNSTCCQSGSGYKCCPYSEGVCCGEDLCCPSNYPICKVVEKKCYTKDMKNSIDMKPMK